MIRAGFVVEPDAACKAVMRFLLPGTYAPAYGHQSWEGRTYLPRVRPHTLWQGEYMPEPTQIENLSDDDKIFNYFPPKSTVMQSASSGWSENPNIVYNPDINSLVMRDDGSVGTRHDQHFCSHCGSVLE